MKRNIKRHWYFTVVAALMFTLASCSKGETATNNNDDGNINVANLWAQVNRLPKEPLSQEELASLMFMREEEKLARDVYITMYNKWRVAIFASISTSEQTHMEAMLMLLNKYDLTDPVGTDKVGIFNNGTLQNLYNQLVARGNTSVLEAYQIGASIEEFDLFDLKIALPGIDNQDIRLVYDMLAKGSRNHHDRFIEIFLPVAGRTYHNGSTRPGLMQL